jgi:V8-like Glu-specific endopeptidase
MGCVMDKEQVGLRESLAYSQNIQLVPKLKFDHDFTDHEVNLDCKLPPLQSFSTEAPDSHQSSNHLSPFSFEILRSPSFDARSRVENSRKWPYCANGVVIVKFNETTYLYGSGTLISNNHVLTAAHILYIKEDDYLVPARSIRYLPAIDGNILYFSEPTVTRTYIPEEYITSEVNDYSSDYALLVLDRNLANETGNYGVRAVKKAELEAKNIGVFGYPKEKIQDNYYEMWGAEGLGEVSEDGEFIVYDMDTSQGQAGAGVGYRENDKYYVVGVHSFADRKTMRKFATLLNEERVKKIKSWVKSSM